jgi:hypothetical protein
VEEPLKDFRTAFSKRIVETLSGAGAESVSGHPEACNADFGHDSSTPMLSRCTLSKLGVRESPKMTNFATDMLLRHPIEKPI